MSSKRALRHWRFEVQPFQASCLFIVAVMKSAPRVMLCKLAFVIAVAFTARPRPHGLYVIGISIVDVA